MKVFLTGAAGFVGKYVVNILLKKGYKILAGVHNLSSASLLPCTNNLHVVQIDINDKKSLRNAMEGVDSIYHFAALVNSGNTREQLNYVNAEGTKNVWQAAGEAGIKKALYCSTTAVYGLLSQKGNVVTEQTIPKSIEPYGNSKLQGERIAAELGIKYNVNTLIIRPTAIFGPGEHTLFGNKLRDAMVSKILIAGTFANKSFNYVHVEDVAEAAVFLMEYKTAQGEIFNIVSEKPILYENAFAAYLKALKRLGAPYNIYKRGAIISLVINKVPFITKLTSRADKLFFSVWRPGFDISYSSEKLLKTSFTFKYNNFEDVLYSCADEHLYK